MKRLVGLDIDNTVIEYGRIFSEIAVERGIVEESCRFLDKKELRERLIDQGMEDMFTAIQGQVYGKELFRVKIRAELKIAISALEDCGCTIVLVSHKTRHPYMGPKYDLRKAADEWLRMNGITEGRKKQIEVHYADTVKEKIEIVKSLGCHYFVDDLSKIVRELECFTNGILYDPSGNQTGACKYCISEWRELTAIIENCTGSL